MSEEKIEDMKNEQKVTEEEKPKIKKNKIEVAKEKIENAKTLKAEINDQIAECTKNIDGDIDKFNIQKEELFASALYPAEKLLERIEGRGSISNELPQNIIEFGDPEEGAVEIKELSSGRFKGFFFALLAGVATLFAWCFVASKALGLSMSTEKVPSFARINRMFEWTSAELDLGTSANIGAAVVIIGVLLIIWIVYALIVFIRASSNLKLATETEEAMTLYCNSKEECKEKMKLVREHIQNSTKTLGKYRVLLEEQNAKITRALFLEESEDFDGLHAKTKEDVNVAEKMVNEVSKLLKTPVSEAGMLTSEASEVLRRANKSINDHILELYS